jgi:hypothetical protein
MIPACQTASLLRTLPCSCHALSQAARQRRERRGLLRKAQSQHGLAALRRPEGPAADDPGSARCGPDRFSRQMNYAARTKALVKRTGRSFRQEGRRANPGRRAEGCRAALSPRGPFYMLWRPPPPGLRPGAGADRPAHEQRREAGRMGGLPRLGKRPGVWGDCRSFAFRNPHPANTR